MAQAARVIRRAAFAALLAIVSVPGPAQAQTRAEEIEKEQEEKAQKAHPHRLSPS